MSQSGAPDEHPKVRWPETQRSPVLRSKVCSPVYRCFPPRPTICLFCGGTDRGDCPFDSREDK